MTATVYGVLFIALAVDTTAASVDVIEKGILVLEDGLIGDTITAFESEGEYTLVALPVTAAVLLPVCFGFLQVAP